MPEIIISSDHIEQTIQSIAQLRAGDPTFRARRFLRQHFSHRCPSLPFAS